MPNLKARLLIVDDEPLTRNLLSQIFAKLGHPVRAAEDGFSALEQIREEEPDILLSDLNMPGMSGFELLSVVRRRIPRIYVIATSGAFSGGGVPHGIAADAFHEKATGLESLFQLVRKAAKFGKQVRADDDGSAPIWISPAGRNASSEASVLIACPECLRAFSLSVGAADFVIHETRCVYCATAIHYATVQPMNPQLPHHFRAPSHGAPSSLAQQLRAPRRVAT
jgi:CheY-like chemotaxis protein